MKDKKRPEYTFMVDNKQLRAIIEAAPYKTHQEVAEKKEVFTI